MQYSNFIMPAELVQLFRGQQLGLNFKPESVPAGLILAGVADFTHTYGDRRNLQSGAARVMTQPLR